MRAPSSVPSDGGPGKAYDQAYDYVVVGGGSAGCVVASRLSEDPGTSVLLLEAGGEDRHWGIHVPAAMLRVREHPRLAWRTVAEPEAGTKSRRIEYVRGRVLGGTSSINGLIYIRGLSSDFDHWAQLGNRGWSAEQVMPYYRRSEAWLGAPAEGRGTDGPQPVSPLTERPLLCEAFRAAAEAMGLRFAEDLNLLDGEGVGYYQQTRRGRFRASTARSYLSAARGRPNLRIVTGVQAERLEFDAARRATGVVVRTEAGQRRQVFRAAREVVVCCGALGSPHLLMLSGLGPAEHLAEHGITVAAHLPGVGQEFQDHFVARVSYRVRVPGVSINTRAHGLRLVREVVRWAADGSGILSFNAAQLGAFVRSRPGLEWPDLQYVVVPGSFRAGRVGRALDRTPGMTCGCWQVRPESRGTVTLRSADARDGPVLRPNSLATETDRRTIVAGLRRARDWCRSPALGPYRGEETLPGDTVQTDSEWLDYAREVGASVGHYAGTCRMGADPRAVVDERLRVRGGVEGLRVVDASVMPSLVSANTNATTIMIAEKAAEMIRADAR